MSYEIPRNLTKYSEKFLWGLTFKQFMIAAAMLVFSSLIFFKTKLLIPSFGVRLLLIIPIVAGGSLFLFFGIEEKIKDNNNLKKSLRDTGYFDSKIENLVDVEEITDNIVVLKNGSIQAILEINPIDFSILSESQKKTTLLLYDNWLRSIDYPLQIVSRSVNIDLNEWLSNLSENESVCSDKERFDGFKEWINEKMKKNHVRNRVFYVVITQQSNVLKKKSFFGDIKDMITGNYGSSVNKGSIEYKNSMRNLGINLNNCIKMLEPCGVSCRRLETNDLMGIYTSYFTNSASVRNELLTPIMWLDKVACSRQDVMIEGGLKNVKTA